MASITKRPDGKWRARYRDDDGKEHAKHCRLKKDAEAWIAKQTVGLIDGTHVSPKDAKVTVKEWSEIWLEGKLGGRLNSVRVAKTATKHIVAEFGPKSLKDVRPSHVKTWTGSLKASGLADATVYTYYSIFAQMLIAAVEDGYIPKSPLTRRTTPPKGKQRPYVASTEQVWALYDAMPDGMKNVILLGAFAGLRVGEISALRVEDVDPLRGVIHPKIQYPSDPLKTEESKLPIPIPLDLVYELNKNPAKWSSPTFVTSEFGRSLAPRSIDHRFKNAKVAVKGLPEDFRIHDLRHYFASLLISEGLDVKVVQARLRHASAKTTLDVYGHLWPDSDDKSRAVVGNVLAARADCLRTGTDLAPRIQR